MFDSLPKGNVRLVVHKRNHLLLHGMVESEAFTVNNDLLKVMYPSKF